VVIYTLWDAVFNSSKNLMKVGKYYIQCSWETTSPFWPLVHLDFLQTASSPLKGNLFPQDLRIYDFVPSIFVLMCCDILNWFNELPSNEEPPTQYSPTRSKTELGNTYTVIHLFTKSPFGNEVEVAFLQKRTGSVFG
jgi:hypothetical protein